MVAMLAPSDDRTEVYQSGQTPFPEVARSSAKVLNRAALTRRLVETLTSIRQSFMRGLGTSRGGDLDR
jgi:hypothetical protein